MRDRGLYRLHQFTKVEMFAYVAPSPTEGDAGGEGGEGGSAAADAGAGDDGGGGSGGVAPGAAPGVALGVAPNAASEEMLARLLAEQMSMYEELGLHCRVLDMPTEVRGRGALSRAGRAPRSAGVKGAVASWTEARDHTSLP